MSNTEPPTSSEAKTTVSKLLEQVAAGSSTAADLLFEAVYAELHELARSCMRRERTDHTLQPTALVHEAYLRLVKGGTFDRARGRAYFFATVAKAMGRILIEYQRQRSAKKRGGESARIPVDDFLDSLESEQIDVIELNDLLDELERLNEQHAAMLRSQIFWGATVKEIAESLGISTSKTEKGLRFARAWIYEQLREAT